MTRPLARFVFQLRSYLRAGAWTDDAAGASRTYTIAEKQHPSPSYRVLGRIINRGNDLHGRTTRHLRSTTPLWTKFKLNHVGPRGELGIWNSAEASSGASELAVLAVLHYPTLHESRTTTGIDLLNIASSCRTPATCDYQLARPDADEQARTSKYPTALERVRTFLRAGPELNQIDAPALPRRGSTGESVAGAGAIPAIWVPRPVPQQSGWLDRSRWETSRCGGEETTRRTGQCPLHGTRECSPGVQQQHHGRRPGGPPPLRPAVPLRRQLNTGFEVASALLPARNTRALRGGEGAFVVQADIPSGYKFLRGMSTLRILRIHDPALGPGNSLRATGQVLRSPRGDERTYLAVGPLHPPTHRAAPQLQPQAYQDSQRSTRQGLVQFRCSCASAAIVSEVARLRGRSRRGRHGLCVCADARPASQRASVSQLRGLNAGGRGLQNVPGLTVGLTVTVQRPPVPPGEPLSRGPRSQVPLPHHPIKQRNMEGDTTGRCSGERDTAQPPELANQPPSAPRLAPPSLVVLDAPPPRSHSRSFTPWLGKKASSGALLTLTRPARQYARFLLLRLAFSFIASAAPYTRFCSHPASRTGVATPTSFCFAGATANIDAFLVSSSRKHCANLSRLSAYHRRDQLAGTCHRPIIFEPRFGCQSLSGLAPFSESLAEPPRRHCVLERLSQGFFVQGRGLASETILHNPQHTAPMFVEG
ncbi:hypothetical protein ACCO45_008756 [Purpureocillium lilacinum]|uniref:Uncharacterized protein n=1 Tax=Purpureocillium lilacinum TaxID=33203 RepID=A0ACC4DKQ1_PURLI